VVGTEHRLVDQAIAAAARRQPLPLEVAADRTDGRARLRIAVPVAPAGEPIAILTAITQDGLNSDVARGENRGRRLHHVAVARTLERIGVLSREPRQIQHSIRIGRDWGERGFKAVVWLQGLQSRQVYGAAVAVVGN
jgi:hypothetical protein